MREIFKYGLVGGRRVTRASTWKLTAESAQLPTVLALAAATQLIVRQQLCDRILKNEDHTVF